MSVGKPFSEPYGTLEALRQLVAVWNEGPPMKHCGAQLEAGSTSCPVGAGARRSAPAPTFRHLVPLGPATSPPQLDFWWKRVGLLRPGSHPLHRLEGGHPSHSSSSTAEGRTSVRMPPTAAPG
jgi:hypothetical protein